MDREAWHAAVHGVVKSWTRLSNWTELSYCLCDFRKVSLEKSDVGLSPPSSPRPRYSSYPWFSVGKVLFLWLLSRFFSWSLIFYSFNMKCLDTDFLVFILVGILLSFLELWFDVFHYFLGILRHYCFTYLFHIIVSFFSFSYTHCMCYTFCNCSLVLGYSFLIYFFLYLHFQALEISVDISSSSLTHFSAHLFISQLCPAYW